MNLLLASALLTLDKAPADRTTSAGEGIAIIVILAIGAYLIFGKQKKIK